MTDRVPPAALARRLERELTAWMCTLRPDGSPHLTPVWFVYRDRTWWVGSEQRAVKARNVTADPRVSFALPDGNAPVVAEGRATIHPAAFPAGIVEAFAAKYGGWDITVPERPGGDRVLFEVPVHRWLLSGTAQ